MTDSESIDCIELKRKSSQILHEKLSKMTYDERIAYWKKRAEEMIAERNEWRETDDDNDSSSIRS